MHQNVLDRIKFLRESALVERCHTLPHHGSYSLGQHCYGMLILLLDLHPSPTVELMKAISYHDAHERLLGDIPATAFWTLSPEFRNLYDEAVEKVGERYALTCSLTPGEIVWLQALDKLDLYLWAKEQQQSGDRRVNDMVELLERWFMGHPIPAKVVEFLAEYDAESRLEDMLL